MAPTGPVVMHHPGRRSFKPELEAGARLGGGIKGGADGTELDVGEDDGGAGNLDLDLGGDAGVGGTAAALEAGAGLVDGVGRVEPEHVGVVLAKELAMRFRGLKRGL